MSASKKTNKGHIVADENADFTYVAIVRDCGWNVTSFSPSDRNKKISDPEVSKKYTKGIKPILTGDKDAYKLNPAYGGASGYVIHESVKLEQKEQYELKIKDFFSNHTQKDTKGVVWTINRDGVPTKEKMQKK